MEICILPVGRTYGLIESKMSNVRMYMKRHPEGEYKAVCRGCTKEVVFRYYYQAKNFIYCSHKCYTEHVKILKRPKPSKLKGRIKTRRMKRFCLYCENPFPVLIKSPHHKYCSCKCYYASRKGRKHTEETKKKMSGKSRALRQDPEFIKKCIMAARRGQTKPEIKMQELLNRLYPGEYKYTGDGSFSIDGLNPDFVNVNGQKKIIEVFGIYFHDPKFSNRKIPYRSTYDGRKKVFSDFGYETLIIWDEEMKDMEKVKRKVRGFHVFV